MAKGKSWDDMIETDEMIEMIKKDGAEYFAKESKYRIDAGIYLERLIEEHGFTRKDIIRRLNLEDSYGRKIFGGQRTPTRKILLQCAFLLSLNLEETQRLLDVGQKPRLYPRVRYDAAIIHGIEKGMNLEQMNAFLEEIGEPPIF